MRETEGGGWKASIAYWHGPDAVKQCRYVEFLRKQRAYLERHEIGGILFKAGGLNAFKFLYERKARMLWRAKKMF